MPTSNSNTALKLTVSITRPLTIEARFSNSHAQRASPSQLASIQLQQQNLLQIPIAKALCRLSAFTYQHTVRAYRHTAVCVSSRSYESDGRSWMRACVLLLHSSAAFLAAAAGSQAGKGTRDRSLTPLPALSSSQLRVRELAEQDTTFILESSSLAVAVAVRRQRIAR